MGWAIQRADGTYRVWDRYGQSGTLQAGEHYVELSEPPAVTFSLAQQNLDVVRDAYVAMRNSYLVAKASLTTFNTTSTLANAKPAIIDMGKCLEDTVLCLAEVLKAINRRTA